MCVLCFLCGAESSGVAAAGAVLVGRFAARRANARSIDLQAGSADETDVDTFRMIHHTKRSGVDPLTIGEEIRVMKPLKKNTEPMHMRSPPVQSNRFHPTM